VDVVGPLLRLGRKAAPALPTCEMWSAARTLGGATRRSIGPGQSATWPGLLMARLASTKRPSVDDLDLIAADTGLVRIDG
jgi:hypothetical protein